jgi:hypothetical protein
MYENLYLTLDKFANMSRLIRENREFVLDFFSTKGGKVVILPPFGERITSKDFAPPKIKFKKKKSKCELTESLINKGFDTTIILKSCGESIEVPGIHTSNKIKQYFVDAISVQYKEIGGWKVSKTYNLQGIERKC